MDDESETERRRGAEKRHFCGVEARSSGRRRRLRVVRMVELLVLIFCLWGGFGR